MMRTGGLALVLWLALAASAGRLLRRRRAGELGDPRRPRPSTAAPESETARRRAGRLTTVAVVGEAVEPGADRRSCREDAAAKRPPASPALVRVARARRDSSASAVRGSSRFRAAGRRDGAAAHPGRRGWRRVRQLEGGLRGLDRLMTSCPPRCARRRPALDPARPAERRRNASGPRLRAPAGAARPTRQQYLLLADPAPGSRDHQDRRERRCAACPPLAPTGPARRPEPAGGTGPAGQGGGVGRVRADASRQARPCVHPRGGVDRRRGARPALQPTSTLFQHRGDDRGRLTTELFDSGIP